MRLNRAWKSHRRLAIALLLTTQIVACNRCSKPGGDGPVTDASPTPVAQTSPTPAPLQSTVSRRNSNVGVGKANQTEQQFLTDNAPHPLFTGDRIGTDPEGEAEVNINDCMKIYVFKSSQLIRAACSKSDYASGSVTCAAAGTSLFNNSCGNKVVIETNSAEIVLNGTYLSVTYLPTEQLTLVAVFKGQVTVRPVTNFEERTLGEPTIVSEGNFVLSVPEDRQAAVRNMDIGASPGKVLPLVELQRLVGPLKLQPWFDRIAAQAKADGIAESALVSRIDDTNQPAIDCDCANVSAGLLTGPYQRQCRDAEAKLKAAYASTGQLGKCDPVASGPNARPK